MRVEGTANITLNVAFDDTMLLVQEVNPGTACQRWWTRCPAASR